MFRFLASILGVLVLSTTTMAASLTLAWDDPNNPIGSVDAYHIERSQDNQVTWIGVGDIAPPLRTIEDVVISSGPVCWRVIVVAGEISSEPTSPLCVHIPFPAENVSVSVTITVTNP